MNSCSLAQSATFMLAVGLSFVAHAAEPRSCDVSAGELVSAQGSVEVRNDGAWGPIDVGQTLCDRESVRTGENSRAAIRLVDDAVLRLDENTTLVLADVAPEPEKPSLLRLVFGAFQSFSRNPQTLQVDTPYVNATVEGTEFALRVTSEESQLTVLEGVVLASNDLGSTRVASGGGAVAREGSAPRAITIVRPRDAVNWGLYYPPALALSETGGSPTLSEAARLAGENRVDSAIALLAASRDQGPDSRTYQAALLLSVGRADDASALLDSVLASEPGNAAALAQSAIIDVAQNRPDEGLAKAEQAVASNADSAAAHIALSYAQQSRFRLDAARDTLLAASQRLPDSALVWTRLSEIWLTLGYRDRSGEAADRALALDPSLARAQAMKGFAALTEFRTEAAAAAFRTAIDLDPADPMPRLGLGLALIRDGELEAGRGEIDAAVALDSNRSILRSYLGKAYSEEDRDELADEQWIIAKELDPEDPTPHLYEALQLQRANRPGEALGAIQQSIARNDNRAVYRGRLQLDQDQAARTASLGSIYEDLGFIVLGLREATRSQLLDPANAAPHRFLADLYRNERRRELSRVSELTRAQLLQDVNLQPLQPSLAESNLNLVSNGGPANAGFNEFTALFASDGFRVAGTGQVGNNETFGAETAIALQHQGFSLSAGAFTFDTEGFRQNFDVNHAIYGAFAQWAVTPELNFQVEVRRRETKSGDLDLNFDPDLFRPFFRTSIDETTARVGGRWSPDPSNDTLVSLVFSDRAETFANTFQQFGFTNDRVIKGDGPSWQGEAQHIFQHKMFTLTVGGSYSESDQDIVDTTVFRELVGFPPFGVLNIDTDIQAWRIYAYADIDIPVPDMLGDVVLTLGASYDDYDEDQSILVSQPINPADVPFTVNARNDINEFNPKAGIQWDITEDITLRGAYAQVVKPPLVSNRTIEPTQVAGFNQYFDDANATKSQRYGAGLDIEITDTLFVGAEATWRNLEVPFRNDNTRQFERFDADEQTHRVYANFLPHPRVPVGIEFIYDRYEAQSTLLSLTGAQPTDVETISVPVTVRYFDPSGFFAGVRGTYVWQDVARDNPTFASGDSNFLNVDAVIGYRFPNQLGAVTLEAQNLLDQDFKYQDDGFREFGNEPSTGPYFPEFGIMGRLTVNF